MPIKRWRHDGPSGSSQPWGFDARALRAVLQQSEAATVTNNDTAAVREWLARMGDDEREEVIRKLVQATSSGREEATRAWQEAVRQARKPRRQTERERRLAALLASRKTQKRR